MTENRRTQSYQHFSFEEHFENRMQKTYEIPKGAGSSSVDDDGAAAGILYVTVAALARYDSSTSCIAWSKIQPISQTK